MEKEEKELKTELKNLADEGNIEAMVAYAEILMEESEEDEEISKETKFEIMKYYKMAGNLGNERAKCNYLILRTTLNESAIIEFEEYCSKNILVPQ